MLVAFYIGGPRRTVRAFIGWVVTRASQKGEYSNVTHGEAILVEHEDGTVDIGSSTLMPETKAGKPGVRIKERVKLTPGNWIIVDVPQLDAVESKAWFVEHDGEGYDLRGATVSVLPIWWCTAKRWFCYQAVGASVHMKNSEALTGSLFTAVLIRFGKDVTQEFFDRRRAQ